MCFRKKKRFSTKERIDITIEYLESLKNKSGLPIVSGNGLSVLETCAGKMEAEALLYDEDVVATAHVWCNAGTTTAKHHHKAPIIEHISIYKGKAIMKVFNMKGDTIIEENVLIKGDVVKINPLIPHVFCFPEDTCMIVTTIPADPNFPKNEQRK